MTTLKFCIYLFGGIGIIELIIIVYLLNKIETIINNSDMEPNEEVTEFLATICKKIPYFIDKKLMDEFDVELEYKGIEYHLTLTKKIITKKSVWKKWKELLFECSIN